MSKKVEQLQTGTDVSRPIGKTRIGIILILFIVLLVAYLDRVNVSILIADPQFLDDMGIKGQAAKQGLLMSLFLIPYAFANLFLGRIGDRIGPRITMTISIFLWSIALFIGGAARSFAAMLGARAALGLGEGLHWPMQSSFVKNWFPIHERARANGIWGIGLLVGPAIAMPIVTMIVGQWGWRMSFYSLAILGLILPLPLLWFLTADSPKKHRFIGKEERDYIEKNLESEAIAQQTGNKEAIGSVKTMLKDTNLWLITIGSLCLNAIWFGILLWLPQYLKVARGFSWTEMGWLSALPYVMGTVSVLAISAVSDKLKRRAPFFCVGMLLGGLFLYLAATTANSMLSVAYISAVFFFVSWGLPTSWTILQSILPAHLVGGGAGIMNGISSLLGGALSPVIVGILIGLTGNYTAGFMYFVGMSIVGGAATFILVLRKH